MSLAGFIPAALNQYEYLLLSLEYDEPANFISNSRNRTSRHVLVLPQAPGSYETSNSRNRIRNRSAFHISCLSLSS
eukprot:scaffold427624_cov36-Prasinocladus_malaysianus.AAC.1